MNVIEAVQLFLGCFLDGVVVRSFGVVDKVVEALSAETGERSPDALHEGVERADIHRVAMALAPASVPAATTLSASARFEL